jgi:glutamate-1-semialdehyde 2,1-aminomutase
MTGFRVARGSAQGLFGITPDLTCFGKIIGGGLPVGAYGGKRKIMDHIAPVGPVYQAGTLSGNPLAMAAGIATLKEISKPGFYEALDAKTEKLIAGLRNAADKAGIDFSAGHIGSMAGMFFTKTPVTNFDEAKTSNLERFATYYNEMRKRGIYIAPSQFEAVFVSAAHSDEEIEATINAAVEVMKGLA